VVNVEVGAQNVANVEAKVAACRFNGRSCTDINFHNTSVGFTTAASLPDPRPGLTYIPVHECQLDAYKNNLEDKALVGVLLKAHQYTLESANNERKIQFDGQSSYQQCSKARKRQHYDCILIFADILHPNKCFAIICDAHQDSIRSSQHCSRTQEGVGDMFIIIEPDMVEYYLGNTTSSVPIVKSPKNFIPVNNRFLDVIPHNKLITPDRDHTSYFCLHEQMIRCSQACLEYASCSGLFCDRQRLNLGPSEKCGCMYVSPEARW
jgi:hypothetical protein